MVRTVPFWKNVSFLGDEMLTDKNVVNAYHRTHQAERLGIPGRQGKKIRFGKSEAKTPAYGTMNISQVLGYRTIIFSQISGVEIAIGLMRMPFLLLVVTLVASIVKSYHCQLFPIYVTIKYISYILQGI